MAVGAIEPQFYATLLEKLNLTEETLPQFEDFKANREKLEEIFKKKSQQEWMQIFDGTDACVTPVLNFKDVVQNRHNKSRESFLSDKEGKAVPNVAPKMSRTPGISKAAKFSNPHIGEHSVDILKEYNYDDDEITNFLKHGIVMQHKKSKL